MGTVNDPGDCAECGFVASEISQMNATDTIRNLGTRYQAALRGGGSVELIDARLRQRPAPNTWSALEYAAHMRDVIALWGWALYRTLGEDSPQLPAPDSDLPDRTAVEADYNSQEPAMVQQELSANAIRMANKVETIGADQWCRTARFGDTEVTALWIVRHVAHEGHHHLLDIEKSLGAQIDQ